MNKRKNKLPKSLQERTVPEKTENSEIWGIKWRCLYAECSFIIVDNHDDVVFKFYSECRSTGRDLFIRPAVEDCIALLWALLIERSLKILT